MSDFVLDIAGKQRTCGIRAHRIQQRSGQHSVSWKCFIRLWVLVINLVQGTTTNVTEVAPNQGIVVGSYITIWLPENSIDICRTGHDRAIVVSDAGGAGDGCSRKLSVAPA